MVILPGTKVKEAFTPLERIRKKTEEMLANNVKEIIPNGPLTVSIGFAEFDHANPESFIDLKKRADDALYFAKGERYSPESFPAAGRNKVVHWSPTVRDALPIKNVA